MAPAAAPVVKFAAAAFTLIGMIAIASLLVVALIPGFLCENALVSEVFSPNGERKAVVFQRACSGTQDLSTQVSLAPADAELPNGVGNIFIANTNDGAAPSSPSGGPEVNLRWRADSVLALSHHPDARVFLSETAIDGIRVEYDHL